MHQVYCENCERIVMLPFAVKEALGRNTVERCGECHEDGLPVSGDQI